MTHYRIENALTGDSLGDFETGDEESAIRAMLEDKGCTDEVADDVRVFEIVTLGSWNGTLEAATYYMDEELQERLRSELHCHDQEWLDTYCREHAATFGEEFLIY